MNPFIITFAGKKVDLVDPDPDTLVLEDIAHSLAHLCRYTGHTDQHYSVAQHSVLVSELLPPHLAFEGLMHDASEAYVGDLSAPLKSICPSFRLIEDKFQRVLALKYGTGYPHHALVSEADRALFRRETQVCFYMQDEWRKIVPREKVSGFYPWKADYAKYRFVERFDFLLSLRTRGAA